MGITTAQLTATYYERFKNIEVTFSKERIQTTGLVSEQIRLKCGSDFWPCVFIASTFQGAKIVANVKSGLLEKLRKANNTVSLRLCFKSPETGNPIAFFIAGHVVSAIPYKDSEDVSLFSIQFTQRPPDDFIEIIGRVLDADLNFLKNRNERIIITPDAQRKLNLLSNEVAVFIQAVPRRCLLRELSFTNVKVITMGVAKFMVNKETALRFDFDDPRESILVKGKFTGSEQVEGKKEMVAMTMEFHEDQIPMNYKIRINNYLTLARRDIRVSPTDTNEVSAAPKTRPLNTEDLVHPASTAGSKDNTDQADTPET